VPIVFKSGSLSLLEPSRSVQACNGIALPLPLPFTHKGYSEQDGKELMIALNIFQNHLTFIENVVFKNK